MEYVSALLVLSVLGGALAALLVAADRLLCNYGPCAVRVNDREPFVVDGGGTLLDALYARRIFIPSACGGQGTCGYCKVQVRSGGGGVLPTERAYLRAEEIADGVRLACQVKVRQDLTLAIREDYLGVQEFTAVVTAARLVTHDTREIHLQLTQPPEIDFRPGQYVQVRVPARGAPTFRAYSISSPPGRKDAVELLVRRVPGGVGSTYLHRVQPGAEVAFTGPYGEFVLDENPLAELVCVGGGCGMAPMRSILRHLAEAQPLRPCRLFYGARTARDAMYLEEFGELQRRMPDLHVYYALSEPARADDGWDGETGFVHESVRAHLSEGGERQAFLCGPPAMIQATRAVLREKHVPDERVFADEF